MADLGDASSVPPAIPLASGIPTLHYLLGSLALAVLLYNFLEFHIFEDLLRGYRGDRVHLTFNRASEVYHGVASKCRALHGRYLATPWLSSPHLQTAFLNFFGNSPEFRYRREIFRVPDGGTIALDWLLFSDVIGSSSDAYKGILRDATTPIVIIVPGLTSDSDSSYLKHFVYDTAKQGWNVVVSNHRGLGGISITSDCFYNAGWTEDIRNVINYIHQEYPKASLFAVGTSIGANILVKYLGEEGENTPVAGAASVCSPWDLLICDRFINRKLLQKLYDRVLTIGLKGYAQLHQHVLARMADWEGITKSNSVREFDNYATRLLAKYETVDTFYRRCSCVNYVENVAVPLLCISALDDPVCTREAIPWDECRVNKNIVLATTTHGGHLAYFQGIAARKLWWVGAVGEFISVLHSSSHMHRQKEIPTPVMHSPLESSIDKAPYVNVMEDGMLTAVGNEGADDIHAKNSSDKQVTDEKEMENVDGEIDDHQMQHEEHSSEEPVHGSPESFNYKMSRSSGSCVSSVDELVAPVKITLNQLSRRSSRSLWLLAYIAIVTTWPLVGPVLLAFLKKRSMNVLPAYWRRGK